MSSCFNYNLSRMRRVFNNLPVFAGKTSCKQLCNSWHTLRRTSIFTQWTNQPEMKHYWTWCSAVLISLLKRLTGGSLSCHDLSLVSFIIYRNTGLRKNKVRALKFRRPKLQLSCLKNQWERFPGKLSLKMKEMSRAGKSLRTSS